MIQVSKKDSDLDVEDTEDLDEDDAAIGCKTVGLKWGREVIFPANPDLADILAGLARTLRLCLDVLGFYSLFWGQEGFEYDPEP